MSEIQSVTPGAMAAVIGLEADAVSALCEQASQAGTVAPANLNSPVQIVVSGEEAGVDRLVELATDAGAKRALRLQVGAAFHSELMKPVQSALDEVMQMLEWSDAEVPLAANASGELVYTGDNVRQALVAQIASPVRWVDCVRRSAWRALRPSSSWARAASWAASCGRSTRMPRRSRPIPGRSSRSSPRGTPTSPARAERAYLRSIATVMSKLAFVFPGQGVANGWHGLRAPRERPRPLRAPRGKGGRRFRAYRFASTRWRAPPSLSPRPRSPSPPSSRSPSRWTSWRATSGCAPTSWPVTASASTRRPRRRARSGMRTACAWCLSAGGS